MVTRHCPACWAAYRLDAARCPRDGAELIVGKDPILHQTVGQRYRVESLLGEGGMGRVYRVQHVGLDKTFALKVIYGDLAMDSRMVARFEREARACSRLDHPCIVSTIDFAATPEGLLYLVLEYLEGFSLSDLLNREKALDAERSLLLFRQVLEGLVHAHTRSLIHRDLKPSNLLLVQRDAGDLQVKIVDFGLAHLQIRDAEAPSLTRAGEVFGTPEYMAPEQVRGAEVTPQADLYAAGIILYEMIEGRPPFRGATTTETLVSQVSEDPPPFGSNSRAKPIPPRLADLVLRMLRKEPAQRPASAAEVLEEVDAILGDLGVSPAPLSRPRGPTPPPEVRARRMTPPTKAMRLTPAPQVAEPAVSPRVDTPPARVDSPPAPEAGGQTMLRWGGSPSPQAVAASEPLLKLSAPQGPSAARDPSRAPVAVIRLGAIRTTPRPSETTVPPHATADRTDARAIARQRSVMAALAVTATAGAVAVFFLAGDWHLLEIGGARSVVQDEPVEPAAASRPSAPPAPPGSDADAASPTTSGSQKRGAISGRSRNPRRGEPRDGWVRKGEAVLVTGGLTRRDVTLDARLSSAFGALRDAQERRDASRAEAALDALSQAVVAFDYPRAALKEKIESLDRTLDQLPMAARDAERLRTRLATLVQRLPTSLGTREGRREIWRDAARIEQDANRLEAAR